MVGMNYEERRRPLGGTLTRIDISAFVTSHVASLGQPMLGWDTYVAQRQVYRRRISANSDICTTLHLTALSNVACVVHLQPLSHRTKQSLSHENFHIPMLKAVGCLTKEYCAASGVASRGPNRQADNPTRFLLRLAEECKNYISLIPYHMKFRTSIVLCDLPSVDSIKLRFTSPHLSKSPVIAALRDLLHSARNLTYWSLSSGQSSLSYPNHTHFSQRTRSS